MLQHIILSEYLVLVLLPYTRRALKPARIALQAACRWLRCTTSQANFRWLHCYGESDEIIPPERSQALLLQNVPLFVYLFVICPARQSLRSTAGPVI